MQQLCRLKHMMPGKHPNNVDRKQKRVLGDLNWTKKVFFLLVRVFVKPRENSNFRKKDKIIISVKIRKFSRYGMMKRTSPLESSREI